MTGPSTGYRRYDDEEFIEVVDIYAKLGPRWIGTATIATVIGCRMDTANRRLLAIAAETDIEVCDPERGAGVSVDPGAFDGAPRRQLAFRREPDGDADGGWPPR